MINDKTIRLVRSKNNTTNYHIVKAVQDTGTASTYCGQWHAPGRSERYDNFSGAVLCRHCVWERRNALNLKVYATPVLRKHGRDKKTIPFKLARHHTSLLKEAEIARRWQAFTGKPYPNRHTTTQGGRTR